MWGRVNTKLPLHGGINNYETSGIFVLARGREGKSFIIFDIFVRPRE